MRVLRNHIYTLVFTLYTQWAKSPKKQSAGVRTCWRYHLVFFQTIALLPFVGRQITKSSDVSPTHSSARFALGSFCKPWRLIQSVYLQSVPRPLSYWQVIEYLYISKMLISNKSN